MYICWKDTMTLLHFILLNYGKLSKLIKKPGEGGDILRVYFTE